jgi:hypothetical protein
MMAHNLWYEKKKKKKEISAGLHPFFSETAPNLHIYMSLVKMDCFGELHE